MRHFILPALLLAALPALAAPVIVKTTFPTTDTVIADAVFNRLEGDNGPALQAAIDDLASRGGGTIFLPAGTYALNTPVIVKDGVTLRGDNPGHYAPDQPIATGTVFAIEQNAGQPDATPAFSVESGSGLRELVFWYPRQSATQAVPYPWTVATKPARNADNQSVFGCVFVNAYQAIRIGSHGNELHTIRDTAICPLKTGIDMDSVTDIGRLDHVLITPEVWAFTDLPDAPARGQLRLPDASGVVIHRSDWEYVRHVTIRGLGTGIRFCKGVRGTTNAVMHDVTVSQCDTALHFDEINGVGIAAHDCRFQASRHPLRLTDKFLTLAQFNRCRFSGGAGASIVCDGKGTVTFAHCTIDTPAVTLNNGQMHFADCSGTGTPIDFAVGTEASRLHIIGGDARNSTPQSLTRLARLAKSHGSTADCVVSEQPDDLRQLPASAPVDYTPHRVLPAFQSPNLLNVMDFGARPSPDPKAVDGPDNGPAFAAALAKAATLPNATVYVPAGHYHFHTNLTVPPNTELRGCYAVPHHTASGGSVLHIHQGRYQENSEPFLQLQHDAGLRGLTIWYPEQLPDDPVPYPWTVRALGQNCWLVDVTAANCWQFADFASCDTTGHLINYIAGGFYRRGLFVATSGWGDVLDVQFNPHYIARLPVAFPPLKWANNKTDFAKIVNFQRAHLEGLVFTDVLDEILNGTFLYAATDGLSIKGTSTIKTLMHGSDTVWNAAVLDGPSPDTRAYFALAQLVSLGDRHVASIVTRPAFTGYADFTASQMWAGTRTAQLDGPGTVVLDQLGTLTGPVNVNNGTVRLFANTFTTKIGNAMINVGPNARQVTSVMAVNPHGSISAVATARNYRAFANSSLRPLVTTPATPTHPFSFHTDFETPGTFRPDTVAAGGGLRDCTEYSCRIVDTPDAHSGRHAVLLKGRSNGNPHSFVYCKVADGPFTVMPDTILTYWLKPLNETAKRSCLDIKVSSGPPLRDRGIADAAGRPTHPCTPRGIVGQWTKYTINLGQTALNGLTIDHFMLAWDSYTPNSDFAVMLDDITMESILPAEAWTISPRRVGNTVVIDTPSGRPLRYTLDGLDPTLSSPRYNGTPITLPASPAELRYSYESSDGTKLSPLVFGTVF